MMAFIFAMLMLLKVTNSYSTYDHDSWKIFGNFQETFERKYESLEELIKRFNIFIDNLNYIERHNVDSNQTFTLGINQFSDLTVEEFKEKFTGSFINYSNLRGAASPCTKFQASGKSVPDSVDWRQKNAVTGVKDQGQCGSCWSFSSTGAMEGAWAISKGELVSLSEQQLVDCSKKYGNLACNGGLMDNAFAYAIDNGMCSEASYPYVSGTTKTSGTCQASACKKVVTISKCNDVAPNNQLNLKEAVANGPVSIAIEADTRVFQSYSSGVITSSSCGTTLDHGVLIVGYGVENGVKYWLVKNSWGTSWGDDGYVKIERSDSTNDPGICGIAMQPSFPIV